MNFVSFTNESHLDPNGVLETHRMEEYPSPDAATMVVHKEDDPEHSFPFRDYSVCKDDKIWTEVIIDISTVASFQLRNKFETIIASAPCPRKWVVFHEPTLLSDLPYFGASYPSEDITEHLLIITQLRTAVHAPAR